MTTGAHPSKIDSVPNERDQCSSEPVEVRKRETTTTPNRPAQPPIYQETLSVVVPARTYRCGHSKATTRKDTHGNGPR